MHLSVLSFMHRHLVATHESGLAKELLCHGYLARCCHCMCSWQAMGIPTGLLASLVACKNGVRRAHLVDARIDGGLILELYSRDGVGTMISSDFYEVRCLQMSLCRINGI